MGSKVCHDGKKPVMQELKVINKSKHQYVALHPQVPRLSCASTLVIDISKNKFDVFDGVRCYSFETGNVDELLKLNPGRVFLEKTGVYHKPVTRVLLGAGVRVFEVNTRRFKRYREQLFDGVKTDRNDVRAMWEFAKLFKCQPISQLESPFNSLLRKHRMLGSNVRAWKVFLESARINEEEGNIVFFKEQIRKFEAEQRKIVRELKLVLPRFLVDEFGTILTATLLSIGPERYSSSKRWVSGLGFKLRQYESGSIAKQRKLSKQGSSDARRLLCLSVMVALRRKRSPYFEYAERLRGRGKVGYWVMVAVMRKMARVFWAKHRDFLHMENKDVVGKIPK